MANIVFIFRTKAFQVPPVYAAILSFRPPVSTYEAALETPSFSEGQELPSFQGEKGARDPSCRKTRYRTRPVGKDQGQDRGTWDLSCQEDKALPARAQVTRPVTGQETSPVRWKRDILCQE
jgi:hypothetical protein